MNEQFQALIVSRALESQYGAIKLIHFRHMNGINCRGRKSWTLEILAGLIV